MWFCFFLLIVVALVHEGGRSRRREQGSDNCGYNGDSSPGDGFDESAQLYYRVQKIYRIGELGDKH